MLIRLLALFALLWTGKQIFNQVSSVLNPQKKSRDSSPTEESSDDMVKDPVCQTYLPKSIALQRDVNGSPVYFCSEECATKFIKQQQPDV